MSLINKGTTTKKYETIKVFFLNIKVEWESLRRIKCKNIQRKIVTEKHSLIELEQEEIIKVKEAGKKLWETAGSIKQKTYFNLTNLTQYWFLSLRQSDDISRSPEISTMLSLEALPAETVKLNETDMPTNKRNDGIITLRNK